MLSLRFINLKGKKHLNCLTHDQFQVSVKLVNQWAIFLVILPETQHSLYSGFTLFAIKSKVLLGKRYHTRQTYLYQLIFDREEAHQGSQNQIYKKYYGKVISHPTNILIPTYI